MLGTVAILSLLGVLFAVFFSGQVQRTVLYGLINLGMENRVPQMVSSQETSSLMDGVHILFCGSGSPMSVSRAGPCTLLLLDGKAIIIDAGPGSFETIKKWGGSYTELNFVPAVLDALFLTHFHSDHIDGIPSLLMGRWTMGNAQGPLKVFGPPGVTELVDAVNLFHRPDTKYRLAHHNRPGRPLLHPDGGQSKGHVINLDSEGKGEVDPSIIGIPGLKVTAVQVDHNPVSPAYGYVIDYKGFKIAFSGDTIYSSNLEKAALGAHVLVHEVIDTQSLNGLSGTLGRYENAYAQRLSGLLADIIDYHTSIEDVVKLGLAARVQSIVFSHIASPDSILAMRRMKLTAEATKEEAGVSAESPPDLLWAYDGMHLSLTHTTTGGWGASNTQQVTVSAKAGF